MKKIFRKLSELFYPEETLSESKQKWERFGAEDPFFHVLTNEKSRDEELFRKTGEEDYQQFVAGDPYLQSKIKHKKDALEIGCGVGRITEFLAKDFDQVYAVDISSTMIATAKQRLSHVGNAYFFATDGVSFPAKTNTFDLVFSFIVFQHMPSKEVIRQNIEEIARTLKPGGVAKIQLRGAPIERSSQYYGPHFDVDGVEKLVSGLPLRILKQEGVGRKHLWLWLEKTI